MTTRRSFLKALVAVPFAPALLRGMDWAAATPAEAAAQGAGGYSCTVPPGTILPYVGTDAPAGFLPCDGRAIPKVMFPKLYDAIGDAYGSENGRLLGVRRFRVPDLRARAVRFAEVGIEDHWSSPVEPFWAYVIRT